MTVIDEREIRSNKGRRDSDNLMFDGQPWYVRTIAIFGVPSAIAAFLIWFLTQNISAKLDASTLMLQQHTAASTQLGETLKMLEQDHRDSNARIEGYMRLICVQQSKNAVEQNQCLNVR